MREARRALHPRTHDALAAAGKTIVLLNRRGWSNFLTCRSCGRAWECPSCDVTLVMHRRDGLLACHHCGHRERVPSRCPDCGSVSIARHGTGTERLEAELDLGVPVFRLDADVGDPAPVLAPLPGGAARDPRRHADGGEGPRLPRRRPRDRRRRRRDPALPGLPGRGADVRAGDPARRPRGPQRGGRARARADARARGALDRPRRAARRGHVRRERARVAPRAALPAVLDARADRVLGRSRPVRPRRPRRR